MFIKNKYIILLLTIVVLACLIYILYKDNQIENVVKKEYLNNNMQMIQSINPLDTTFLKNDTSIIVTTPTPTSTPTPTI